jgi:GT2 family glycosyltransferase
MRHSEFAYSKVAIVILNWNGKKYLEQFLPKLIEFSQYDDVKIYIADNGSKDDSIDFLKKNYPGIELILFNENYGFTGGYNKALQLISAQYFIIVNSDIEVTENWIHPVINYMDSHSDVAASQPKIRSFTNKEYFEYAGAAGGYLDKFGYPFCRGRILKFHEKDTGQYDELDEIFWATGACMFARNDLFIKTGGFDEDFFAHMEEIDLCWRFKNAGYKIVYIPQSTVYHVGGGTLPNDSPNKLYLNYRNNLFLLYKNLASSELILTIFQRLLLDGLSGLAYFFSGRFIQSWMVFKAHLSFYASIRKMHRKRDKKQLKLKNISEIYPGSIVFSYFVKKRHYFSNLNFRK